MIDPSPISLAYRIGRDLLAWRRRRKGLTDQERISRRTSLKAEFEGKMDWQNDLYRYGQVIIRDIRRADDYPELESTRKGISPWFKMALVGLYHRGIEVAYWTQGVKIDPDSGQLRLTEVSGEKAEMQLQVVRRIPFDWIVSVDWSGDEYYPGDPMIYCEFMSKRGEPYEKVVLSQEVDGIDRSYYQEVADYHEVYKASKRWKRRRWWRAA